MQVFWKILQPIQNPAILNKQDIVIYLSFIESIKALNRFYMAKVFFCLTTYNLTLVVFYAQSIYSTYIYSDIIGYMEINY